ncbi:hypothetical protein C8F01DRAFT_1376605 [Mycena amicta]|nr:hypothetical protein C8F01DRAFT_1376605 [Mycena amicta]
MMHPHLHPSRLSRLPQCLRTPATAVTSPNWRRADLVDLQLQLDASFGGPHHELLLPSLFALLDPVHTPNQVELAELTDEARLALDGVELAVMNLFGIHVSPEIYVCFWPRLNHWLHLMQKYRDVLPFHIRDVLDDHMFQHLGHGIRIRKHGRLSNEVLSSQFRFLVAHAWALTLRSPFEDLQAQVSRLAGIFILLNEEFPGHHAEDLQDILEGIDGSVDDLARLVTQHLRVVARIASVQQGQQQLLLTHTIRFLVITAFRRPDGVTRTEQITELAAALSHSKFIELVTEIALTLSRKGPLLDHMVLGPSLHILVQAFRFSPGAAAVVSRSVNSGLLDIIIEIGTRSQDNQEPSGNTPLDKVG